MLEKQKDIDAVLVATPDHTHAVIAMAAMQLGKHVYVQKPLTRTISEARALTEAARKYKVVTQMGNQGHSEEGLRLMQEWLDAGAIGQVREVHCWTNRPIWPQGMPRPTETPADARRAGLGSVDRSGADAPLPPDLSPVRLARVAGLRRRRDGRHGVPRDGRGVHDPEARRADERDRDARLQLPAAGARAAWVRPARRSTTTAIRRRRSSTCRSRRAATCRRSSCTGTTAASCRSGPRISSRSGRCRSRARSSSATRARCGARPTRRARGSFPSRR